MEDLSDILNGWEIYVCIMKSNSHQSLKKYIYKKTKTVSTHKDEKETSYWGTIRIYHL